MYSLRSVQARQKSNKTMGKVIVAGAVGTLMAVGTWVVLFTTGVVTLGGVPYTILLKVWQNPAARSALLGGEETELHNLMGSLGIEYDIKEYYRDRIQDPVKLDQHIHQILFDRTGYVGENYTVRGRTLVLKDPSKLEELRNCPNC
ncbi:hypothetical protein D0962_11865 [Leptolyngbyaceae cyanobacterium CCMR0082]|uniref:Uncharacterized protein n=2 Tax=Adonisia turfae TaxID=2950184 RepID=A0A6M0S6M7_9CYAN|nr:hypothetical protein [Adonisia turfae]MDV3350628.1 hypothetical protein [Leptothoe sp. LEGE 181152]NEZ55321.1 hypothetical protein [Adonisia turfae CCMR0081]NEZ63472.1 hypothetical protein [Adonisia turfae CCMR0082]